jgi:hypothetical protein
MNKMKSYATLHKILRNVWAQLSLLKMQKKFSDKEQSNKLKKLAEEKSNHLYLLVDIPTNE